MRVSGWLPSMSVGAVLLLGLVAAVASIGESRGGSPEPTRVLVFGDSLSAAYRLPVAQGWVAQLDRRIEACAAERFEITNASVSGETTSGGLSRLPGILETAEPDWVLLELGANDGLRGLPLERIETNLQALIDRAEASGAEVVLLGIMLPSNYGPAYAEPFREMYTTLAEANDLPALPFLLEGVADDRELMMSDGIHPNAAGQERVLENVWGLVAPLWGLDESSERL